MELTKLLVENILKHPDQFDWSTQGLGMMRMYLSQEVRLHVWDSSLKVAGVSALHTHPWDMESLIVAGRYKQHRYRQAIDNTTSYAGWQEFKCSEIKCGEGAHTMADPRSVWLYEEPLEIYIEGQRYTQTSDEIHLSIPEDGTVTIVHRTFKEDRDHAFVFWRGKGGWVDAAPRPATLDEITAVTQRSLQTWF